MVLERFDQETTKLIPGAIEMMSSTELSQYNIQKWQLNYYYMGIIFFQFYEKTNLNSFR